MSSRLARLGAGLPPKMTTTERDAISSPATGLLIYNTTTNLLNVYDGTSWGTVMPTVDTAGEGGFWGAMVFHPQISFSDSSLSGTPNTVKVYQFVLPFRVVIRKITWEVTTLEVGKFIGAGMYNAARTAVLVQGKVSTTTTGVKTVAITPVTLEPGVYWHAWTADGSTVKARHINLTSNYRDIFNENSAKWGTAANSSVAGVLPATLGTITPSAQFILATYYSP